jgi:type II secretory pathway component PulM
MDEMDDDAGARGSKVAAFLRHPVRLRVAIAAAMGAIWYFAAFEPMNQRVLQARTELEAGRKRLEVAEDVEALRAQVARFETRLPRGADANEVVHYLLDGLRTQPVKMENLEPRGTGELGPYRTVSVGITATGPYAAIDSMLRWLESDPRLFRVETLSIAPLNTDAKAPTPTYKATLGVLGVILEPAGERPGPANEKKR